MHHYSRAPIAEAVIDLRVEFARSVTLEAFEGLAKSFSDRLPHCHTISSLAFNLAADGSSSEVVGQASSSTLGVRLSSASNDRVLQLQQQGFAYSHLPPYSDWETFVGDMQPLWQRFADECAVKTITRTAVRYINRIPAPPGSRIADYLVLGPHIPEAVSKQAIGYFMQVVVPAPDLGPEFRAVINTGVEPGSQASPAALLLDIDVFCEKHIDHRTTEVWDVLERLRRKKNSIFEASITDAVREMIR